MKNRLSSLLIVLAMTASLNGQELPYQNSNLSAHERAVDLLGRLTLEEKVQLMKHDAPAIPRLGIPAYNWWNEALHGVARR